MIAPAAVAILLSSQGTKAPAIRPVKNVFAGRVVDCAGKPLADVTVGIFGTTNAEENTRFEVTTDGTGGYRQRVPAGIYGAAAYYQIRYRGDNFKFTLTPDDGITAKRHDSEPGVVKNFTWRIAGLKPGERAGTPGAYGEAVKYYGNSAQIVMRQEGFDSYRMSSGSSLELVFTPTGPLIDGSGGKPQKRTFAFPEAKPIGNLYATDLPVGAYSVSAIFVRPDGARIPLPLRSSGDYNGPMKASLELPFRPTQFGDLQQAQITLDIPKG